MVELANICARCGSARLERDTVPQEWCRGCGGSGYELTSAGKELKSFVLALLLDPKVKTELVDFVASVRRGVRNLGD